MNPLSKTRDFAKKLDHDDALASYREQFYIPQHDANEDKIYLTGNSLGLQPIRTKDYLEQELEDWQQYGVEGHFHARKPWMPYHEFLTDSMAKVVGALSSEVVVMNTLSVNLHLMMVSFYRPSDTRFKIVMESDAFPSDRYAIISQLKFHGIAPAKGLVELTPRDGEVVLRPEDVEQVLTEQGSEIALVLLGGVNYYTGQVFDMKKITSVAHAQGCKVGFDLAHGAGNIACDLHDSEMDFAVWCTYKYLNSGPGSLGGCFVHERHHSDSDLPRFAGWWGHNKDTRFNMRHDFDPIHTAEGWQLSNPPILSMAAIRASLEIFEEATMPALLDKSVQLTGYMEFLVDSLEDNRLRIITPRDKSQRGCQLSIQMLDATKDVFNRISELGVVADWREPDVIRVAPVPLYNSFEDVWRFVECLKISRSHA